MPSSLNNATALLKFDPAAVAISANNNDETLDKLRNFATKLTHYVDMMQTTGNASAVSNEQEEEEIDEKLEDTVKIEDNNGEEEEPMPPAAPDSPDIVPSNDSISGRRKRPSEATAETENEFSQPRKQSMDYKGDLEGSRLSRSVGRTRKILNVYLKDLGLTAKFSNAAIAKHRNAISHITLDHKWNDLPFNRHEPLKWWIGEGASRLAWASVLDPSQHEQPAQGVPVFWATNPGNEGLCHYIGHFRCIKFERLTAIIKNKPRQALLQFAFACQV